MLILHLGGYDLKALYSLEEYYARQLGRYYDALSIGPSHNYYEGRAGSDITKWVEYFCDGVADSFENVWKQAQAAANIGSIDKAATLRNLDPCQRKTLILFRKKAQITSRDVESLFGFSQRTARNLLSVWTEGGFVVIKSGKKEPELRARKSIQLASGLTALHRAARTVNDRLHTFV